MSNIINTSAYNVINKMVSKGITKTKAEAEIKNEQKNSNSASTSKQNNEESLSFLNYQGLMNKVLVNNKANTSSGKAKTYSLDSKNPKQTIVINGKKVEIAGSVSNKNGSIKLTVDDTTVR